MARSIQTLIRKLLGHADCKLRAPSRRVPAAARKKWPKDLLEFYSACDGGKLFDDGSYGWAAPKRTLSCDRWRA
jgi:hypothetical protein